MDKITITAKDGEQIEFYVVEQTKISGVDYLLVTETKDENEDAEAYILKDVSKAEEPMAVYEFVEDEDELNALAGVFSEMFDDEEVTFCK
ncbi:MAG: DUF1292 domain-containing protein [Butyrivibrio sp.]|nr:DUF1292 domain-containing protein [Butyrivibrio sp.]